MGTHLNKLDAKGRVSIPAPFRNAIRALDARETTRVVLRPSHVHACLEAWPEPMFKELEAPLQKLAMFSEEYDDLAGALYIDAHQVESDKEGRIGLPGDLGPRVGVKDSVMFMGYGKFFMIWEPGLGDAFRAAQRDRQKQKRITAPPASNMAASNMAASNMAASNMAGPNMAGPNMAGPNMIGPQG